MFWFWVGTAIAFVGLLLELVAPWLRKKYPRLNSKWIAILFFALGVAGLAVGAVVFCQGQNELEHTRKKLGDTRENLGKFENRIRALRLDYTVTFSSVWPEGRRPANGGPAGTLVNILDPSRWDSKPIVFIASPPPYGAWFSSQQGSTDAQFHASQYVPTGNWPIGEQISDLVGYNKLVFDAYAVHCIKTVGGQIVVKNFDVTVYVNGVLYASHSVPLHQKIVGIKERYCSFPVLSVPIPGLFSKPLEN